MTRAEAIERVSLALDELNKARKSEALCRRADSRIRAAERVAIAESAYREAAAERDRIVAEERKS